MKENEYKCAMCNGVFQYAWTEEEALAECKRDFGDVPPEYTAIICDDCYQKVRPDRNLEQLYAYKAMKN